MQHRRACHTGRSVPRLSQGITAIPGDRRHPRRRASHDLSLQHFTQPDDVTCGPTCLRKVYNYYGLHPTLDEVLAEVDRNEDGGTLAVFLAVAALRRGFNARIYSYNLRIFDPTWQSLSPVTLARKLAARIPHLQHPKTRAASRAYLEYLELGGGLRLDELTPRLLREILDRDHPILAGLSATHLYRMPRERHHPITHRLVDDDVAGDPIGHFVVVSGYDRWGRRFIVRDPSEHVPSSIDGRLVVPARRLINSILLGDLTYDAVLLELWPGDDPTEAA